MNANTDGAGRPELGPASSELETLHSSDEELTLGLFPDSTAEVDYHRGAEYVEINGEFCQMGKDAGAGLPGAQDAGGVQLGGGGVGTVPPG